MRAGANPLELSDLQPFGYRFRKGIGAQFAFQVGGARSAFFDWFAWISPPNEPERTNAPQPSLLFHLRWRRYTD